MIHLIQCDSLSLTRKDGRFIKGEHRSPATEFKPGQHWRSRKPCWDREWLRTEYSVKHRTAAEIARQLEVTENAILFWLAKHGIPRRSMKEIRKAKHWGIEGSKNGMYGKRGILNANWRGGLSPLRQTIYSRSEWKTAARAVHKRDKVCRLCNSKDRLEIHHIDPFSEAPLLMMDIGNMILLCSKCHKKMRGKERRWKKKLFRLIGEGRPQ